MSGHASLVSGRLLKPALSRGETVRERRGRGRQGGEREKESEKKGEGNSDERGERERANNCRQVPTVEHEKTKKPEHEWSKGQSDGARDTNGCKPVTES